MWYNFSRMLKGEKIYKPNETLDQVSAIRAEAPQGRMVFGIYDGYAGMVAGEIYRLMPLQWSTKNEPRLCAYCHGRRWS